MKRSEAKSIREIMDEGMRMTGMADDFDRRRASALWPEIVGPAINRLTSKRFVDADGVLHVALTSAVVKNELSFNREALVAALNRAVGRDVISDIHFH